MEAGLGIGPQRVLGRVGRVCQTGRRSHKGPNYLLDKGFSRA